MDQRNVLLTIGINSGPFETFSIHWIILRVAVLLYLKRSVQSTTSVWVATVSPSTDNIPSAVIPPTNVTVASRALEQIRT